MAGAPADLTFAGDVVPPGARGSGGAGPGPGTGGMLPSGGGYDSVHLSSRNARLEEKLAKSLAKNRSLARYYDQLLVKSREAQERDIDDLRARIGQGEEAERQLARLGEDLERAVRERNSMAEEVKMARSALHQADAFRREETASLNHAISKMTEQIAERDSELSEARRRVASQQYDGAQELQEMRKLLKQAREERESDRTQDNEVAKQLAEIKQQALDRIQENVDAQKEVAAVSEQLKRAEIDTQGARRALAEAEERAEEFEQEADRLRRQLRDRTEAEARLKGDAAVATALQERLRASERERESDRQELSEARKRVEALNDKMALLSSEKELLVRHSAQSGLIEAQLTEAKFEIERYKKVVEGAALQSRRADAGSQARFDDMAQVLRLHIFQHSQDNHRMTATLQEAREVYHMAQRSAARLVARAEREASDIVLEAVQAVQSARRAAAEVAREVSQSVNTTMVAVRKNARATIQDCVAEKERALAATRDASERAERAELEARRARMLAADAGGHLKALLQTVQGPEEAHPELAEADVQAAIEISHVILAESGGGGPPVERAMKKELARTRFLCMALALYKKSTEKAQNRNILMLQASVKLANNERRETQTRHRQSQLDSRARKAELLWAAWTAALLRKAEQKTREEGQAVVYSLTQKTLQLQLAKKERDSALKTIKQHEANIAYLRSALDAQARGKGVGTGVEELRSAQSRLHESEHALDALGRKISMLTEEIRTVGRDIQQVQNYQHGQPSARRELEGSMRDRLKEIEDRLPRRGSSQADQAAAATASNLLLFLEKAALEALVDSLRGGAPPNLPSGSGGGSGRGPGGQEARRSHGEARGIGSDWGDTVAGSWHDGVSLRPSETLSPVQVNLQDLSAVEMLNSSPVPRRKSVASKLKGLRKPGPKGGQGGAAVAGGGGDPFAPESIADFHERISKWNEDFAQEEGLENFMDASRYSAASAGAERAPTRKPAPKKAPGQTRKAKKAGKVGRYF